jgi:hypothetical protein
MNISPEQSQALLDAGHISPDTHQAVLDAHGVSAQDADVDAPQASIPSESDSSTPASGPAPDTSDAAPSTPPSSDSSEQSGVGQYPTGPHAIPMPATQEGSASAPAVKASLEKSSNVPAPSAVVLPANTSVPQNPLGYDIAGSAHKVEGAYNAMQEADIEGKAAKAKQAGAESAYLKESIAKQDQMANESKLREQNRQKHMTEQSAKLQKLADQYSSSTIDPKHFWADKNAAQKVSIGIGMFLGGLGGGPNQAVQLIENAIGRDIDAQKANVDKLGKQVSAQQNVYQNMREQFGDDRQAEAATRLMYLNKVQTQLQQVASQYKGPQIMAQAKEAYGKLEIEKQGAMQTWAAAAAQSQQFSSSDEMTRKIAGLPKEQQAKAIEEMGTLQSTKSAIDTVQKSMNAAYSLQNVSDRVMSPTQSNRQLDVHNAAIRSAIMNAESMKRLSPEILDKLIEPNLPGLRDNEKTQLIKKQAINDLINKNSAPTPILTGHRIAPAQIDFMPTVAKK